MTSIAELRQRLLHPYYIVHFIYGTFYAVYFLKTTLASDAGMSDNEVNAYLALLGFSVWKCVIASTAEELVSVLILYGKFFTFCMLYWKTGIWRTTLYSIGWIVISTLFPQPWYQGPTNIVSLSETAFREKVQQKTASSKSNRPSSSSSATSKGPGKYWVVMLYANWSVACLNFEAVLAKLSLQYKSDNVEYGKIDIDIYPDIAQEYAISRDPASFDLPTLLLFKDGVQIGRLPELSLPGSKENAASNAKNTITRLGWSKKAGTVIRAFQLDKIAADK